MPDPFSRRKPYPWDARLRVGTPPDEADVGLLIADALVAKNVQSMAAAVPNSQEYGQSDLYRERSAAFQGPLLGYGEGSQRGPNLGRYHYAINAWVSGLWRGKGPLCHLQTPPVAAGTGGPILGFIGARHTGAPDANGAAFALDGRYVVRRVDDGAAGWTTSRDGGAGFVHESAARFWHAGTGAADRLYVAGRTSATDTLGQLWMYDGATWTQAVDVPARFLVRLDDRLIRAWGNQTSQCSADPMVAANWTGGIRIGDDNDVISGLAAVQGVLYLFTRTGRVFTLNADGTANDLYPGLAKAPELDPLEAPGGQATPWLDALWFRSRDAFFRLSGGGAPTIEEVGPGRLIDNGSPVQGRVQCFAGHQQWYGFLGVYNQAAGDSFLLQHGDWLPQEGGSGGGAAFRFVDALHGALVHWPGKRVTALQTTDLLGPNPRLYCGFTDGTIEWFDLPREGPNPFAVDAACTFTERESYTVWPLHTLLAPADRKEYTELSVYGPRITPGDSVEVFFTVDPTLLPTGALGRATAGQRVALARALTAPGDAVDFPADSYAYGIVLEERYLTDPTGAVPSVGTPVVSALVLRERLHPKFRLEFQFTTVAGNRLARRDGVREVRSADQLLRHLSRAASSPQTVVLQLPDETVGGFSFISWQQTLPPASARYGTETAIALDLLQFRTEAVFGTIDRLGDLTIDGLGARDINALGTL